MASDGVFADVQKKSRQALRFPDADKRLFEGARINRREKLKVSTVETFVTFRYILARMHSDDKRATAFKVSSPWARKWANRYKLSTRRQGNSERNREEKADADSRRFPRRTGWVSSPALQVHQTQSQRLQSLCGTPRSCDSIWTGVSKLTKCLLVLSPARQTRGRFVVSNTCSMRDHSLGRRRGSAQFNRRLGPVEIR